MPTILIPQDITVQVPVQLTPKDITPELLNRDEPPTRPKRLRFVEDFIVGRCKDPEGLKTADALFKSIEVRDLFKGHKAGDRIKLTDAQYLHLKPLVEKPSDGYGPTAIDLGPFLMAVLNPEPDDVAALTEH